MPLERCYRRNDNYTHALVIPWPAIPRRETLEQLLHRKDKGGNVQAEGSSWVEHRSWRQGWEEADWPAQKTPVCISDTEPC